jgi:bifunctional DNA-binding transcriptional regulator/antitoxin component of YhaV-PrlF toxin-antitoxin module
VIGVSDRASATKIVRQLRNGQVTIPADFRRQLGIDEDALLQMTLVSGELRIKPVHVRESAAGSPWLKELYQRFAPVREEAAKYSEEEVDAAIERAVTEVRKRHG